jgi:hypothetical protein
MFDELSECVPPLIDLKLQGIVTGNWRMEIHLETQVEHSSELPQRKKAFDGHSKDVFSWMGGSTTSWQTYGSKAGSD